MAYNENMRSKSDNIFHTAMSLYSDDAVLTLGYFNGGVSLRICPAKPIEERTPKSMYNYDIQTSLTVQKDDAMYIAWLLENVYLPKFQNGEEYFQAIRVGRANMISLAIQKIDDVLRPVITLYRSLDPSTLKPAEVKSFTPRKNITLSEFDYNEGKYTANETLDMDIIKLMMFFKNAVALGGATYHIQRYENRFNDRARRRIVDSIAGKMGIPTSHQYNDMRDDGGAPSFDVGEHTMTLTQAPSAIDTSNAGSTSTYSSLAELTESLKAEKEEAANNEQPFQGLL